MKSKAIGYEPNTANLTPPIGHLGALEILRAQIDELEKRLEQVELQLKIIRQLDERRDKIMAGLHTALEQSNVRRDLLRTDAPKHRPERSTN